MCLEFFLATPNLRVSTARRAMLWIGREAASAAPLLSILCPVPTFPCKRLIHRLVSVPDFISSSCSSQTTAGLLEVQKHAFSGSSRQKHCHASHVLFQNLQWWPGNSQGKLVTARWDRQMGSTQIKVFVVISQLLPQGYSVHLGCALLLAVCSRWKRKPSNQQALLTVLEVSWSWRAM